MPQETIDWLGREVARIFPAAAAATSRLSADWLGAKWPLIRSELGLALPDTPGGPVALRLTLADPEPDDGVDLEALPDGPPAAFQRWIFGNSAAGSTASSHNLRSATWSGAWTWPFRGRGLAGSAELNYQLGATYDQLTTASSVNLSVQPLTLLRSRERSHPYAYRMRWEIGIGTQPSWQRLGDAPERLRVWFPQHLTEVGQRDAPALTPMSLDTIRDRVPLLAAESVPDIQRLLKDVTTSFPALANLSGDSAHELAEFFEEGSLRASLPAMWMGVVDSPILRDRGDRTIGYLRVHLDLDEPEVSGPPTRNAVLESHVLRIVEVGGTSAVTNSVGAGAGFTVRLASDTDGGPVGRGGAFRFLGNVRHQTGHSFGHGGNARISHSLRTDRPLLPQRVRVRFRIELVRPDGPAKPPDQGSPLDQLVTDSPGAPHYRAVLRTGTEDMITAPSRRRYLPVAVAQLRSLGVSTTPIDVTGTDKLFHSAETWLRAHGFLPPLDESLLPTLLRTEASRVQRLHNQGKLDLARSRMGRRAAIDEMIEGGVPIVLTRPGRADPQRVEVRLHLERRFTDADHGGETHDAELPKVQTLNWSASTRPAKESMSRSPVGWDLGANWAMSNPLKKINSPWRSLSGGYGVGRHPDVTRETTIGSGQELYALTPTADGSQIFTLPVTLRMTLDWSHGAAPEPWRSTGSLTLVLPTYRTLLERPTVTTYVPPVPRPVTDADRARLRLPSGDRIYQDGVLRLPESAFLDRLEGSRELRTTVESLLAGGPRSRPPAAGGIAAAPALRPPPVADAATRGLRVALAVVMVLQLPLWFLVAALRWLRRFAVGEPTGPVTSLAQEHLHAALSPQHVAGNALQTLDNQSVVEGVGAHGVLWGRDLSVSVKGYVVNPSVLPDPGVMDFEVWLQTLNGASRSVTSSRRQEGYGALSGSYSGTVQSAPNSTSSSTPLALSGTSRPSTTSVLPNAVLSQGGGRDDTVLHAENSMSMRVTTENDVRVLPLSGDVTFVVTVTSGGRNLFAELVWGQPLSELGMALDLLGGTEFLLVENDLLLHPELREIPGVDALFPRRDAPPDDRVLPGLFLDTGGVLGFGTATSVVPKGPRGALLSGVLSLVEAQAPGMTTVGTSTYLPGLRSRLADHTSPLSLRALVNGGPAGRASFHVVHRSWLGPRLVTVVFRAEPALTRAQLAALRGRRTSVTAGLDNILALGSGGGGSLPLPDAAAKSVARHREGRYGFGLVVLRGANRLEIPFAVNTERSYSGTASSLRERRTWQRSVGDTTQFSPVAYRLVVQVRSVPLRDALLVRLLARPAAFALTLVRWLRPTAAVLAPAVSTGRFRAAATLRFNGSETPRVGAAAAGTPWRVMPALLLGSPTEPVPGVPGGLSIPVEPGAADRALAAGPVWRPRRPVSLYDFDAAEQLADALVAVSGRTAEERDRMHDARSTEDLLIRLTRLVRSGRAIPLDGVSVDRLTGQTGFPAVTARISLHSPQRMTTSRDTAIDGIEWRQDGFASDAGSAVRPTVTAAHGLTSSRHTGGPTLPLVGVQAGSGQHSSGFGQRREILRFGTPMESRPGIGTIGHLASAVMVVRIDGPGGVRWVLGNALVRTTEDVPDRRPAASAEEPPTDTSPGPVGPAGLTWMTAAVRPGAPPTSPGDRRPEWARGALASARKAARRAEAAESGRLGDPTLSTADGPDGAPQAGGAPVIEVTAERFVPFRNPWRFAPPAAAGGRPTVTWSPDAGERIIVRYRLAAGPGRWTFTFPIYLDADPDVSPSEREEVMSRAREGLAELVDGHHLAGPDVELVTAVEFADAARPGTVSVRLSRQAAVSGVAGRHRTSPVPEHRMHQLHWTTGAEPARYVHELLHFAGADHRPHPRIHLRPPEAVHARVDYRDDLMAPVHAGSGHRLVSTHTLDQIARIAAQHLPDGAPATGLALADYLRESSPTVRRRALLAQVDDRGFEAMRPLAERLVSAPVTPGERAYAKLVMAGALLVEGDSAGAKTLVRQAQRHVSAAARVRWITLLSASAGHPARSPGRGHEQEEAATSALVQLLVDCPPDFVRTSNKS